MKKLDYKILKLVLVSFYSIILMWGQDSNLPASDNQCLKCHVENEILPADFSEDDVHQRIEIGCEGCHGGDPLNTNEETSMSKSKGFVGKPARVNIPAFCGKCHSDIEYMRKFQPRISTDQVAQFYTSHHGELLKKGDDNVANCVSCHTAHSILPASDPRSSVHAFNIPATCNSCHGDKEIMKPYNVATDQFEKYKNSIHGKSLLENLDTGSPACNDCHGNHGAQPPGITSIANVCGLCHKNNMDYFNKSKMKLVFEEQEIHACDECHGYHLVEKTSDSMIGVGEESICLNCHEEQDAGYLASKEIGEMVNSLAAMYETGIEKLQEVKIKGMNDVEIEYQLKQTKHKLIQTRTSVHSFDTEEVKRNSDEGIALAKQVLELSKAEIEEYNYRREGFLYISIVFIVFIALLYLKIKVGIPDKQQDS